MLSLIHNDAGKYHRKMVIKFVTANHLKFDITIWLVERYAWDARFGSYCELDFTDGAADNTRSSIIIMSSPL